MDRRASDKSRPTCLLSFDVEAPSQIEAARGSIDPSTWERWPDRIEMNVDWLLEALDRHGARATFFVLGWVAHHRPGVVRKIAAAGHEIACHGYAHDRLHRLTPQKLAADLAAARAAIESQSQQRLRGYRAPSFSLHGPTHWAVDVIAQQGFEYDSSIQPVYHPAYGQIDAPRQPYRLIGDGGGEIAELPPLSWQVGRARLPVAGGGYFRLMPLWVMKRGIAQAHREDRAAMLYFHPWEFDAHQPRLPLSARQRWRTYVGLSRTQARLERLLGTVTTMTYGDWLDAQSTSNWPAYRLPTNALTPVAETNDSAYDVLKATGDFYLNNIAPMSIVQQAA